MKDPGMAVLVNLAQRCRRAKHRRRRLRMEGESLALQYARIEENEAWNALHASKSIYFEQRLKNQQKETN